MLRKPQAFNRREGVPVHWGRLVSLSKWGTKMRFHVCLAALAASAAASSPAIAQAFPSDDAPATARGVVLQQHSLRNQTNLDFGIVTTDGVNPGTVTIAANAAGTRAATNGVTLLPSTYS